MDLEDKSTGWTRPLSVWTRPPRPRTNHEAYYSTTLVRHIGNRQCGSGNDIHVSNLLSLCNNPESYKITLCYTAKQEMLQSSLSNKSKAIRL